MKQTTATILKTENKGFAKKKPKFAPRPTAAPCRVGAPTCERERPDVGANKEENCKIAAKLERADRLILSLAAKNEEQAAEIRRQALKIDKKNRQALKRGIENRTLRRRNERFRRDNIALRVENERLGDDCRRLAMSAASYLLEIEKLTAGRQANASDARREKKPRRARSGGETDAGQ